MIAITVMMSRGQRNICRATWLVTKISMPTVIGATIRITAMSGSPARLPRAGLLITQGIGTGLNPGDTRGWMTRPGDTLHFTTGAGWWLEGAGVGSLDLSRCKRYMHRRWSSLSAAAVVSWPAMWPG